MRLYEEYVNRHNLSVPVVSHADHSLLFSRKDTGKSINWMIFSSQLKRDIHRHGIYHCTLMYPQRGGRCSGNHGYKSFAVNEIEWDDYEDYVLKHIGAKFVDGIVCDRTTVFLTIFEMFVFQAENYFLRYALNDDFVNSLDLDLSANVRFEYANKFLSSATFKTSEIFEYWEREHSRQMNNYSFPLARVIRDVNKA
jgi:hypothetical protein